MFEQSGKDEGRIFTERRDTSKDKILRSRYFSQLVSKSNDCAVDHGPSVRTYLFFVLFSLVIYERCVFNQTIIYMSVKKKAACLPE